MKVQVMERKVMWGDLDPLGIVFYPRYYEWMDGCAHLFFQGLGIPLGSLLRERGIIFGLVETGCTYLSPGRYHDLIRIRASLADVQARSVLLKFSLVKGLQEEPLAEGMERRVCLDARDPGRLRAVEIPSDIREILEGAIAG